MQRNSILVVDDEPDMRMAVNHALCRSGYSVGIASSGNEALEKFRKENYSMVITDLKMPEMSGMEVLEKVKELDPLVPVIMVTAYGTVNNAVEAMKEGAADYIMKPFSLEALESAVRRVYADAEGRQKHVNPASCSRVPLEKGNEILTQDEDLLKVLDLAGKVAPSDATVLIQGESGTGKELLARLIHQLSQRKRNPCIAINCAALPEGLAESELFGHEKGSFTGAVKTKSGKFELANQGTIMLDEISEMPLPLQAKLLRVLQEREIDKVGSTRSVPVDARVIAITNSDLKRAVREGKFREDLYYRLNVVPMTIPPLRERKSDIPLLAEYFLKKYARINKKDMREMADETCSLLLKYDWKGNVRELENTIERAVLLGEGKTLLPKHLFIEENSESAEKEDISVRAGVSLKEMEKQLIFRTLEEVNDNRTHAAKMLGISIRTLRNKLKEYKENP